MSNVAVIPQSETEEWKLPSRGVVGMACLILAEAAISSSLSLPTSSMSARVSLAQLPRDVLKLPIFTSICLLSSSATVHFAVTSLHKGARSLCTLWLAATVYSEAYS